jgi:hypothetical protein
VVGAVQALRQLADPVQMLIVEDSKLISYSSLATTIDQKVAFIAPASKTYVPADVLAAQDLATAVEVDYVAARDAGKPDDRRGRWHAHENTMTLAGPRNEGPGAELVGKPPPERAGTRASARVPHSRGMSLPTGSSALTADVRRGQRGDPLRP